MTIVLELVNKVFVVDLELLSPAINDYLCVFRSSRWRRWLAGLWSGPIAVFGDTDEDVREAGEGRSLCPQQPCGSPHDQLLWVTAEQSAAAGWVKPNKHKISVFTETSTCSKTESYQHIIGRFCVHEYFFYLIGGCLAAYFIPASVMSSCLPAVWIQEDWESLSLFKPFLYYVTYCMLSCRPGFLTLLLLSCLELAKQMKIQNMHLSGCYESTHEWNCACPWMVHFPCGLENTWFLVVCFTLAVAGQRFLHHESKNG